MATGPGCRRCCSNPHGWQPMLAGTLGVVAFVLSEVAFSSCYFMIDESDASRGYGITNFEYCYTYSYSYSTTCYCQSYGSYTSSGDYVGFNYTGAHAAALAFGIIANVFGFVMFIVSYCAACRAFRRGVFIFLGVMYSFCAVSILLTMLIFIECSTCTMGSGAICAIIASVLWIACAVVSFTTPNYKDDETPTIAMVPQQTPVAVSMGQTMPQPVQVAPGSVTITETVQPDGSVITEKVTANPDGSKTVETFTTQS